MEGLAGVVGPATSARQGPTTRTSARSWRRRPTPRSTARSRGRDRSSWCATRTATRQNLLPGDVDPRARLLIRGAEHGTEEHDGGDRRDVRRGRLHRLSREGRHAERDSRAHLQRQRRSTSRSTASRCPRAATTRSWPACTGCRSCSSAGDRARCRSAARAARADRSCRREGGDRRRRVSRPVTEGGAGPDPRRRGAGRARPRGAEAVHAGRRPTRWCSRCAQERPLYKGAERTAQGEFTFTARICWKS